MRIDQSHVKFSFLFKKKIFVFFLLFNTLLPFQNCTLKPSIKFNEAPSVSNLLSIKDEGNGEGYSGKPENGNYIRTFPDYICQGDNLGIQGFA